MQAIEVYTQFLSGIRRLCLESIARQRAHLIRIQAELGRQLIEAKTASEIERAIWAVSDKRKMKWNGGHLDDGAGLRFRLGLAASCFLRWAHREALIERCPYEKNTFRRPRRREAGFLTDAQMHNLLGSGHLSTTDQAIVRFLIDTGLRVGELSRVMLTDLDFNECTVRVHVTKTGKPRIAAFSESTRQWLAIYLTVRGHETPWLFPNYEGGQLSEHGFRERFRKISKTVGFRVHPHMLRHTAGTRLIQKNEQVVVMRYLGHETPQMTAHYIHLTGKDARAALARAS